jgi:putative ABC transport system permease protein
VLQVLINAGLCGLIGATLGSVVGLVIDAVVAGQVPGVEFTTAVGILMVLAALLGSVAPAIRAARLDPVRILRVP